MTGKPYTTWLMAALACLCALPAVAQADNYVIDPMHTFPSFEFSHMGISVWRGRFNKSSGTIVLDRAARTGTVDIAVDPGSVDFGLNLMNSAAVGEEWFDVKKYPPASYKGTIKFDGDRPVSVVGKLSFRGQTKPVMLTLNSFGCVPHPMTQKEVCGADVSGETSWADWGMKYSEFGKGDAGRLVFRVQVEAQKRD